MTLSNGVNLYYSIIENPKKSLSNIEKKSLICKSNDLIKLAWGDFGENYIEESLFHSDLSLFLYDEKNNLIGIAPITKMLISNREILSFGLTVIHPKYRNLSLMKKMYTILGKKILLSSIMNGKFSFEFVFFTPNVKTIMSLTKIATFLYPNPHMINIDTGKMAVADDETWGIISKYLEYTGYGYLPLEREGAVLSGFYDDKKHLVQENNFVDKENVKLALFVKNYLKPGKEVIVRSRISVLSLLTIHNKI